MKVLTSIFALTIAVHLTAQTNIIAFRSHGGDTFGEPTEQDNFGVPLKTIDSLIYIGNNCVVEVSSVMENQFKYDTLREHALFVEHKFNKRKLKKHYPSKVIFDGFKKKERRRRDQQNGISWFAGILVISFLGYLLFPTFIRKRSN